MYMYKSILAILSVMILYSVDLKAQYPLEEDLTHTYSIVAHDPETGEVGVAVQSHWFSVGTVVTWAEAGVGAVATQSLVNVSYGERGLDYLKEGLTPREALTKLLESDEGSAFRQVAIIDVKGRVAVHTGEKCIAEAGHVKGEGFSVQANMMLNDTVWPAMAEDFKDSKGPLAKRLISALKAAEAEGGDIRGQQSAAVLVVKGEKSGKPWEDRVVDIRVDDHPEAVKEIERLYKVYRAYNHMNAGDVAIEHSDVNKALEEYGAAMEMFPDNIEMKFWTAVSLANTGNIEKSLPLFKTVFEADSNWVELTRRLIPNGILQVEDQTLQRILDQGR